jgi:tetratricopeptide (TPR) repeat protein
MARADRRRARRTRPPAPVRSSGAGVAAEQVLFFQRLRGSAKWVFVFLALVFAVSFVVFGVGSNVPGGVADILQGRSASGAPSVEDARERTHENPSSAAAWRDLGTALQADGKPDEAITALERYTSLKPRDQDARRELAGLYLGKASRLQQEVQVLQVQQQFANPGTEFAPPTTSPLGQALAQGGPITEALSSQTSGRLSQLYSELQSAYNSAKLEYAALANLDKQDASVQLQLADAALNAGDTESAVAAYKRFLELAPDDPIAPSVREELKRLEAAAPPTASG